MTRARGTSVRDNERAVRATAAALVPRLTGAGDLFDDGPELAEDLLNAASRLAALIPFLTDEPPTSLYPDSARRQP